LLVLLWDDPGATPFVLTAIGLANVLVGIIMVSNAWTPTYKMILGWDPEAMRVGGGTAAVLQRSTVQMAVTWAAFALFLVALISL